MTCLFITLLVVNIISWRQSTTRSPVPAILSILHNPKNNNAHKDLAYIYWTIGKKDEAGRELSLIEKNSTSLPTGDVLGAWEKNDNDLLRTYIFWKTVADDKPDYLPAQLAAAAYARALGKKDIASAYIMKAVSLDVSHPELVSFRTREIHQ